MLRSRVKPETRLRRASRIGANQLQLFNITSINRTWLLGCAVSSPIWTNFLYSASSFSVPYRSDGEGEIQNRRPVGDGNIAITQAPNCSIPDIRAAGCATGGSTISNHRTWLPALAIRRSLLAGVARRLIMAITGSI